MYLTVPLPIAQTRVFKCFFVPLNPDLRPIPVRMLIPQNASFMQVKERLGSLLGCDAQNVSGSSDCANHQIVGFDLWKSTVYAWWLDSDHNSTYKDSDVAIFYELAVPVKATRKAVGYLASVDTITVPVYTSHSVDSGHRGAFNMTDASHPFFITLTKAEASDPVAVRDAITRGYTRLVKPEMVPQLWVHSGSSKAAVALPHMGSDDDDPVTEIHIDGEQTRVVETASKPSDSNSLNSLEMKNSSASLSTLASAKSGKLVPRGDLFKVHVADAGSSSDASSLNIFKGKDDIVPFYRGTSSTADKAWSSLENRRKTKKNMFGHIATGFKSIVGSSTDDEASPTSSPLGPPLVVRPGEGIFCEWPVRKFQDYFDETKLADEFIDPAIAKEIEKKKSGRSISLDDCLDEFSREETLGQDDLWYCPQVS